MEENCIVRLTSQFPASIVILYPRPKLESDFYDFSLCIKVG